MANLDISIPAPLKTVLDAEVTRTKGTLSSVVTAALSQYLGVPVHTLFQVSISGALVAGVYDRGVSVKSILEHGDFGLGTFANLDGEMVVLDGRACQVQGTGRVSEAGPDAGAPFAVVTRFSPKRTSKRSRSQASKTSRIAATGTGIRVTSSTRSAWSILHAE
jgi:acetolactate decarboxylase